MIFEQLTAGGCQSYLVGCEETSAAVLIDPEISLMDRYIGLAAREGLRIHYLVDTHTHADHFSATLELSEKMEVPTVMHRTSSAPFVDLRLDDGEMLVVGSLRLQAIHTPGHTRDSMCLLIEDRVFTGDTLLIGGTGRTDLPTGNPNALYDSLFNKLLKLDPALKVYPGHNYKGGGHSTIGEEIATNPRLQSSDREEFVTMMRELDLKMPTHITEALRTNMSGGKSVEQMLSEAADSVPFMSMAELKARIEVDNNRLIVLDVRERDSYEKGHIPGAILLPRGQLELRVNEVLPNPTQRIVVYCDLGRISVLATATLREMGFTRAVALDGGMQAWAEAEYAVNLGGQA